MVIKEMNLLDDHCVQVWRGRAGASWDFAFGVFKRFWNEVLSRDSRFVGMTINDVVEWQRNAVGYDQYYILGLAQKWINQQNLRHSSMQSYLSYVCGVFNHNQASLPEDKGFRFKSSVPAVEGDLSVEKFRAILNNCNKLYRAVFLMKYQGLMGCNEVLYVNKNRRHEVLSALKDDVGIFKLPLPGRKRNLNVKNYYTLLSTKSDWATAMHEYLDSLSFEPKDYLFINENGNPLTRNNMEDYFHKRAVESSVANPITPKCSCGGVTVRVYLTYKDGKKKSAYRCKQCHNITWACELGLRFNNNRYGVHPHEIRHLSRSRWRESGAKIVVAEFMMEHGEQVDPNEYDNMKYTPNDAVTEYRKALPWLNILSQEPNKMDRSEIDSKLEESNVAFEALKKELADVKRKVAFFDKPEVIELLKRKLSE